MHLNGNFKASIHIFLDRGRKMKHIIKLILVSAVFFNTAVFAHESDLSHIAGHLNSLSWTLVDKAKAGHTPVRIRSAAAVLARRAYRLNRSIKRRHSRRNIYHNYRLVTHSYRRLNHKLRITRYNNYAHLSQQISNVRLRYRQLRSVVNQRHYGYPRDYYNHRTYRY